MKKLFIFYFLLILSINSYSANDVLPYWKDLNVFEVNKEYPRTTFIGFNNRDSALSKSFEESNFYMSLNGTWKFYYVDDCRDLPENITDSNISISDWKDIKVPGNWELQGFGAPVYVNQHYDFKTENPNPPNLPEATPVGVYRKTINLQEDFKGRDVFLNIGAAKSGTYLYVNGKEVGYSEDSKNPAEFLITPYIHKGDNEIVLKVFKWSTGAYLECQDFFRISGIERDVYLWSQPKVSVRDLSIVSTLDDNYKDGIFKLNLNLSNRSSKSSKINLKYQILDAENNVIVADSKTTSLDKSSEKEITFDKIIDNALQWSAEAPNLYKLLITTKVDGEEEFIPFSFGFRRVEIKPYTENGRTDNLLFVNGKPIILKGVNIHETNPKTGHYVTKDIMMKDFELMKQNNINSVRLSHYPQSRIFYELCDKYGFYVYNEANIESHGMYYDLSKGKTLGNNPDWEKNHIYREVNMFERTKNYASVILWSLGNEAGNGYNFYQAYLKLKELDKNLMNRPVNYERALWEWNTDMFVPQYPSAEWLESIGKKGSDRPVIPSEYSHSMGNSNGNIDLQWQAIYKYTNLQGGYIWEWVDHTLEKYDDQGNLYYAYGGDFGTKKTPKEDMPSDGNFVADGILNADRTPHPAINEVKYVYQNFEFKEKGNNMFSVKNRFFFINSDEYGFKYIITEDGNPILEKDIDVSLSPQQEKEFSIDASQIKSTGGECFVNFIAYLKKDKPLLKEGYTVASEQFRLPLDVKREAYKEADQKESFKIASNKQKIEISSSNMDLVFDKSKGFITSYKIKDKELFFDGFGIQPNFWRGPTDNDYGNGMPYVSHIWKESSSNFKIANTTTKILHDNAILKVSYILASGNLYNIEYTICPSRVIKVNVEFTSDPKNVIKKYSELNIPRIGVRFRIPKDLNAVTYFGKGPDENYIDRASSSFVGLYKTTAEEMYCPYVRPQENGHRTATRWASFTSPNDDGILVVADSTIGFNSLRNSVEDFDSEENRDKPYQWHNLYPKEASDKTNEMRRSGLATPENIMPRQTHINDIVPKDFVEVCIDMKQQGLAGYDSWGSKPLPQYSIPANKQYRWGFAIIPIDSKKELEEKSRLIYKNLYIN